MEFTVERLDGGAVFTVTRPERLNALTSRVWDGLERCIDALERDAARCLVITAQGDRAFSAGADLKEHAGLSWGLRPAKNDRVRNLLLRLSNSGLFSVAAINGLAYGGGLELALACTMRLGVRSATFSLPEIKLGAMPAYGGTQFLPALVGRARSAELMLTGRVFSADEALAWGLLSDVVASNLALRDRALAWAKEVASFSPVAFKSILRSLDAAGGPANQKGMDVEGAEVCVVLASHDAQEGVAAFLEKRKPDFKGR